MAEADKNKKEAEKIKKETDKNKEETDEIKTKKPNTTSTDSSLSKPQVKETTKPSEPPSVKVMFKAL